MRNGILIIGIVFAATLAYVVGNRLSNEAMAVVVGALCGISASVPVSIALFIAASRNWGRDNAPRQEPTAQYQPRQQPQQPPVIIVAPPQFNPAQYSQAPSYYFPPSMRNDNTIESRDFKIIGEE